MGPGLLSGSDEIIPELDRGDGCTTLTTEEYTFNGQNSEFCLREFYFS